MTGHFLAAGLGTVPLFADCGEGESVFYKFFLCEWYYALPLVIMSLIAASLVIWRLLLNASAKTDMDDFLPVFQDTLRKHGIKGATTLCKEEQGLIPSRLFVAGLEASDQGAAAMRRSMATEVELEILPRLNFLLAPILAVAKIATMVGLLFTVISMINTFNAIGKESKEGKVKEVVADWTGEGRLTGADMLRPAGTTEAWKRLDEFELLVDYLPRAMPTPAAAAGTDGAAAAGELPDLEPETPRRRRRADEDADVDM